MGEIGVPWPPPDRWLDEPAEWVRDGWSVFGQTDGPETGRVCGFGGSWGGTAYMVGTGHPAKGYRLAKSPTGYESFLCGPLKTVGDDGQVYLRGDVGVLTVAGGHSIDIDPSINDIGGAVDALNRRGKYKDREEDIIARVNLIETDYGPLLCGALTPWATQAQVDLLNAHTLSPEVWPKDLPDGSVEWDLLGFSRVQRTAMPMRKVDGPARIPILASELSPTPQRERIVVAAEVDVHEDLTRRLSALEAKVDEVVKEQAETAAILVKLAKERQTDGPSQVTLPGLAEQVEHLQRVVTDLSEKLGERDSKADASVPEDQLPAQPQPRSPGVTVTPGQAYQPDPVVSAPTPMNPMM